MLQSILCAATAMVLCASSAYGMEQRPTQTTTLRVANPTNPAKPAQPNGLSQRSIIIVGGKKKPDAASQRGIIIVSGKNKSGSGQPVPSKINNNAAMDRLQGM